MINQLKLFNGSSHVFGVKCSAFFLIGRKKPSFTAVKKDGHALQYAPESLNQDRNYLF